MVTPLLTLQNIALRFGTRPLFTDITMSLSKGERVCLVGRNGTGKSTLMKVIFGTVEPDMGRHWQQPGTRVSYLVQEPDLSRYETIRDYVCAGAVAGQPVEPHVAETELIAKNCITRPSRHSGFSCSPHDDTWGEHFEENTFLEKNTLRRTLF